MKSTMTIAVTCLAMTVSAQAAELATGQQISSAISGNTVQGSMDASGAYTEYYTVDGVVHGLDYEAKWFVEGDKMCWLYEGSAEECWSALIDGDQVSWVKEGKTLGTGTILSGNPNDF